MKSDTFEQAQRAINRGLVEALFQAPGAYWKADEYWTLNPTRSDGSVGSFHIFEHGGAWVYKDFATGESGDVIALLAAVKGCTALEAAKEIVERTGGTVSEAPARRPAKPPKVKHVEPIPPEAGAAALKETLRSDYAKKTHGKPVKGWRYRRANGDWVFTVVRYEECPSGRAKEVVPYYYGEDGKWHEGNPLPKGKRILYGLDRLASSTGPILIVEGEKCAEVSVEGWTLLTWPGGTDGVDSADWSPIAEEMAKGRAVTIWPDADQQTDKETGALLPAEKQPGMKAALAIRNRLPGARILDVNAEVSA